DVWAGGGRVWVAGPAAGVRDRLAGWGGRLSVAAVNGPAATVVSGELGALGEFEAWCAAEGVRARRVPVDYASHGPAVEAIRAEILAALEGITPGPARVPMVSALSGEWVEGPELGAGYWYESLRAPVEFARAVRVLAEGGHGVFVEVSPHPVLTAAVTETVEDAGSGTPVVVTGTLRRGDGGAGRLLASLGEVFVRGTAVDWAAVLPAGRRVELPTYAFQRQRYWSRPPAAAAGDVAAAGPGTGGARGMPAACCPPRRPGPGMTARATSRRGRRKARCRCRPAGSMRAWRPPGTGMARGSAGGGPPGSAASPSSPRSRCQKKQPPTRARSGCTQRCWPPPCTPPRWAPPPGS